MKVRVRFKNPTKYPKILTIPKGTQIEGIFISEDYSIALEPHQSRVILFDENGRPFDIHSVIGQARNATQIAAKKTRQRIIDTATIEPVYSNHGIPQNSVDKDEYLHQARKTYEGIIEERGLGGFRLLSLHSAMKAEKTRNVGLYSPVALGFVKEMDSKSLYYYVLHGELEITSCIANGFDKDDAIVMKIKNNTLDRIVTYIPKNTMFEQKNNFDRQNLVVSKRIPVIVEPGDVTELVVPAMCANSSLSSPSNDAMNLTPFKLIKDAEDQQRVWDFLP